MIMQNQNFISNDNNYKKAIILCYIFIETTYPSSYNNLVTFLVYIHLHYLPASVQTVLEWITGYRRSTLLPWTAVLGDIFKPLQTSYYNIKIMNTFLTHHHGSNTLLIKSLWQYLRTMLARSLKLCDLPSLKFIFKRFAEEHFCRISTRWNYCLVKYMRATLRSIQVFASLNRKLLHIQQKDTFFQQHMLWKDYVLKQFKWKSLYKFYH